MQIIEDVNTHNRKLPALALSIGSFDGVHLGHRRILERVVAIARERGLAAALMTLRPHPRALFSPDDAPSRITNDAQMQRLLEEIGIDLLFILPFTHDIAALDRSIFLERIVLGRCHAKHLVVGHDFAFGSRAAGDFAYLADAAPRHGIQVEQVAPVIVNGERVSSTLIRELVISGAVHLVPPFLGRRYAIEDTVASGRGLGGKLGFATANLQPGESTVPAHGVYAAQVLHGGHTYPAAVNIGIAPTIRNEDIRIEAHLLDFDAPLLGETIEVVFHKRLRPEIKFPDKEALAAAVRQDIAQIREYFGG